MQKFSPEGVNYYPDVTLEADSGKILPREQLLDRYTQHVKGCKACSVRGPVAAFQQSARHYRALGTPGSKRTHVGQNEVLTILHILCGLYIELPSAKVDSFKPAVVAHSGSMGPGAYHLGALARCRHGDADLGRLLRACPCALWAQEQ